MKLKITILIVGTLGIIWAFSAHFKLKRDRENRAKFLEQIHKHFGGTEIRATNVAQTNFISGEFEPVTNSVAIGMDADAPVTESSRIRIMPSMVHAGSPGFRPFELQFTPLYLSNATNIVLPTNYTGTIQVGERFFKVGELK